MAVSLNPQTKSSNLIYFCGSIRGKTGNRDNYVKITNLLRNYGEILTEVIVEKLSADQNWLTSEEKSLKELELELANNTLNQKTKFKLPDHLQEKNKSKGLDHTLTLDEKHQIIDDTIYQTDYNHLKRCHYIVAEVTSPSLGVGFELGIGVALGKPILCLYNPSENDNKRASAMISGCDSLTFYTYSKIEDALQFITHWFGEHSVN